MKHFNLCKEKRKGEATIKDKKIKIKINIKAKERKSGRIKWTNIKFSIRRIVAVWKVRKEVCKESKELRNEDRLLTFVMFPFY